jgi:hypothetical protein
MSATRFRAAFFAAVVLVLAGSGFSPAQAPEPPDAQIAEGAKRIAENVTEAERQRLAAVEAVAPLVRPSLSAPSPVATDGDGEDAAQLGDPELLVTIAGPKEVPTGGYFLLQVKTPPPAPNVLVGFEPDIPDGAAPPIELAGKNPGESVYLYQQVAPGRYAFHVSAQVSVDKSEGFDPHDHDSWVVTVGGPGPVPPPPGPQPPPPVPPPPDPTPDTAPFPATGLHVLIVFETADAVALPAGQRAILYGKANREFLNAKTAPGPDGRTRSWRIYDADTDVTAEAKVWQDAMAVPRQSLPWLVVSNGRTGFSGPLPADPAAFQAIVNQHAGG